jgi:hypothetical protein
MKVEFGKIGLQENVIENFGAHDEILQVRSEAYSSWSEKNVNDSNHGVRRIEKAVPLKDVDSKRDGRERLVGRGFRMADLWKS